jgi:trehalose/maltose hydrolase-like predicted phosphorylase
MGEMPTTARVDKQWLGNNRRKDEPEWELVSKEINNDNFREFFIGNGYIGQLVPSEGEGSWLIPDLRKHPGWQQAVGGCQVHGFTDRASLMDVPRWAGFRFYDGRSWYSRSNGIHENYAQTLNMKHAYVKTELDWFSQEDQNGIRQKSHMETMMWLSRTNRNLAAIQYEVTPYYDGTITFEDTLDGTMCPEESSDWQTNSFLHGSMSLSAQMGYHRRKIVLLSNLLTPGYGEEIQRIEDTERSRKRTLSMPVENGKTYTITKLVGIYTELDGPDLENQGALMLWYAKRNIDEEFKKHCGAWEELWQGDIRSSHKGVQKISRTCLYQLYSQLRPGIQKSLGPTGITGLRQWSGKVFWDADLWMAPPVMLLNPELSKSIVAYRHNVLEGAKRNARSEGMDGALFAWEGMETGDELCLYDTAEQRHHIADAALVQWWYSLIAGDREYSDTKGREVIMECAKYFASRVIHNKEADRYEIRHVYCADEFSGIVDNNTYTNYSAVKTLSLASAILEKEGKPVPALWMDIQQKMYYPYYDEIGTYREHDSYEDQTIKQADTALLIYPYDMKMSRREKEAIVDFYRKKYPPNKIMMSSAIDGVIFCEMGDAEKAWFCFEDLLPHFRLPCLHASESADNEVISFATGLGGLLQLVLNGFCGIRIVEDGFHIRPALPDAIEELEVKGIHCRGIRFDIKITQKAVECSNVSSPPAFDIYVPDGTELKGFQKMETR